ncbi:D-arabinose 5-phosphate isomerase [Citrobacter koseri]|nr:D-arabinose 5-phosphate isomerase [Citrobacter koseri]
MSDALLNAGRQTLLLELQEASRLPERLGDDFVRAANTILHCEGKVIVSGIGKSGHIGKKIAATLASTGTPAFFVHPAEALHGDLGMIESRDVMLFISYSGGAKELDLIIPRLEDKSITLLAMTGKPTSPLGLAAKAVLDISVEREACPMHLAPTSSTVNTLMMGDALAMAVMQARGFNEEDFARSHPAGALGARLLNKVHHLMRRDDAVPQVQLTTSVDGRHAGAEPYRVRSGCGMRRAARCERRLYRRRPAPLAGWRRHAGYAGQRSDDPQRHYVAGAEPRHRCQRTSDEAQDHRRAGGG